MRKTLFVLLLLAVTTTIAKADLFVPGSPGIDFFRCSGQSLSGLDVQPFNVFPPGPGMVPIIWLGNQDGFDLVFPAPAAQTATGLVLYFNGGLTLGELQSVSADSTMGNQLFIQLWLDTNGDGQFFSFAPDPLDPPFGEQLVDADGDSAALGQLDGSVTASTLFQMTIGDGYSNDYTLAELQAGDDPGIGADTPVALSIYTIYQNQLPQVNISDIDVERTYPDTDPGTTPEPSSLILLGTGCLSLVGVIRKRMS
ncbi:MAG: PEP-CTERM sorting domain-containing protein [Acidobacteriaceae bacterium]